MPIPTVAEEQEDQLVESSNKDLGLGDGGVENDGMEWEGCSVSYIIPYLYYPMPMPSHAYTMSLTYFLRS